MAKDLRKREILNQEWKKLLIGQDHAIQSVSPYIIRYLAGLSDADRPLGNIILLGPTGTGKTYFVESLCELLCGNSKNFLKIDCGEFQLEHEVAKLVGSPPGYLGHRETKPVLGQEKLNSKKIEGYGFNIVLFDEIEKAHEALRKYLLRIMDKGVLTLGDNTQANFTNSLIFMTSNLGASEINNLFSGFGFHVKVNEPTLNKIENIALGAVKSRFSPEFKNRLDETITFNPLTHANLLNIAVIELEKLQYKFNNSTCPFSMVYDSDLLEYLLRIGTSIEYGARELKRTIVRQLLNPLADDILDNKIKIMSKVNVYIADDKINWDITSMSGSDILETEKTTKKSKKRVIDQKNPEDIG